MKLKHINNCILFTFKPDKHNAFGYFDETDGEIYISNKTSLLMRECIYLHELTHRECFQKGCKCWKGSTHWCEYHAFKGELLKVIASGSARLRIAYLKNVDRALLKYMKDTKTWGQHFTALVRLGRTKVFEDFVKHYE